jgi:GT2 family glycosyltransferase
VGSWQGTDINMTDLSFVITKADTARIGVVVIGRNEGERLRRCFESIDPALPVVYVDSNSTDGSVALASSRGVRVVELDMSRLFTAARARNAGFKALDAANPDLEFVQFVDGDCEFERDWITTAAAFLDDNRDVAIVCGRRRERFPDASIYNKLCDIEWDSPVGQALVCGGDTLVRIAPFKAAGGFDDNLVAGEEPELCGRVRANGGKIWRIDAAMTIHDAAMHSFSQWWKRAIRGGFGYAQGWSVRRMYGREALRAICWAGLLPLTSAVLAMVFSPWWLTLLLLPCAKIVRDALRLGATGAAWPRAFFLMVAKLPELLGILRFLPQVRAKTLAAPKSYK